MYIPSTFPSASTHIVCSAGIAHAIKWNRCDLFSIASCPHLSPAAKNQASAKHAHQANAAIQQKYNAINKMVHNVDCRCPCVRSQNEIKENHVRLLVFISRKRRRRSWRKNPKRLKMTMTKNNNGIVQHGTHKKRNRCLSKRYGND